jgi:hypothetical protein
MLKRYPHSRLCWSTSPIAKTEKKQPKYPSVDELAGRRGNYTHKWNITQPIKKKEILSFAATWVELEAMMLNTINQAS